jgi:hypothetical protein
MLTVGQTIAIATNNYVRPLHGRDLQQQLHAKGLSFRSVIPALEKQQRGYFVWLRSISILQKANDYADLLSRLHSGEGQLSGSQISAFAAALQPKGVALKLVTPDRRALVIGSVDALVTLPTIEVGPSNVEDLRTGLKDIAQGGMGLAGIALAVVALGASLPITGPVAIVVGSAGFIGALSSEFYIGMGIMECAENPGRGEGRVTVTPLDDSGVSDSGVSDSGASDSGAPDSTVSSGVPPSAIVGDPPPGIDINMCLEALATDDPASLSNGWDGTKCIDDIPGISDVSPGGGSSDGSDGGL